MTQLEIALTVTLAGIWILGGYSHYHFGVVMTGGLAVGKLHRAVALVLWPLAVVYAMVKSNG